MGEDSTLLASPALGVLIPSSIGLPSQRYLMPAENFKVSMTSSEDVEHPRDTCTLLGGSWRPGEHLQWCKAFKGSRDGCESSQRVTSVAKGDISGKG